MKLKRIHTPTVYQSIKYALNNLDQPHRVEAAFWDVYNIHRDLNSPNDYRRTRREKELERDEEIAAGKKTGGEGK